MSSGFCYPVAFILQMSHDCLVGFSKASVVNNPLFDVRSRSKPYLEAQKEALTKFADLNDLHLGDKFGAHIILRSSL